MFNIRMSLYIYIFNGLALGVEEHCSSLILLWSSDIKVTPWMHVIPFCLHKTSVAEAGSERDQAAEPGIT